MQVKQAENGTQSIQRALSIMNCFARGIDSLSLMEISKLVDIPYSTASRIVGVLEQEAFLIRDKHTKRYSLGRRIYGLGYCAKQSDFLRKVTYPYLVRLRDEFGETSVIYIREGDYRVCLEKVSAFHSFKFSPLSVQSMSYGQALAGGGFLPMQHHKNKTALLRIQKTLQLLQTLIKEA